VEIQVGRHNITHIAPLCLEKEASNYVTAMGLQCAFEMKNGYFKHLHNKHDELWVFRAELISHLVKMGLDVIVCDLDAVWVRNPLPYVHSIPADVIGLRGQGMSAQSPHNVGRHVLNMVVFIHLWWSVLINSRVFACRGLC
jgi:hypothetical protein